MANIPLITKRRENRKAELQTAIDAGVEKALGAAQSSAPQMTAFAGATYPVPNPSSPFHQTGGNYGANPLPRTSAEFNSLFGPGFPLTPDALDPLRADGRSDPRRFQYQVTTNIQIGQFGAPWELLRTIASQVDVVSRCIELVQDAVAGMSWSWGFSRQIINQIRVENNEPNSAKATMLARDKYGDELANVQKFWERPDERMGYSFIQWITLAVWAHLVFDGIVVSPQYNLKGDLHSLSILDTSSIKILLDNSGFLPEPPAPAYQQVLWGFPRSEFQAEPPRDGKVPTKFKRDQLSYFIRRPRLHTPYGFSSVEECINYATLYQQRQEWMHAEWSHGVTPKLVIETEGTETWSPEQMMYYQNALNDQWSGQTQRRQQLMMLRPGMKPTQLREMAELYNSEYDQWLVMQIGAKFGVPQMQLGIPMVLHNLGSGSQNTASMDLADKFALDALVNFLVDCINSLARRYLGVGQEITIVAANGNSNDADFASAQADASDVNNGIRTRNEVRAERGIPLITEPEADELAITTATGLTFLHGQLDASEAQVAILQNNAAVGPDGAPAGGLSEGRQRSSRKDGPSDPNASPGRKPAAVTPTGGKDTPHKARSDNRAKTQPDVTPKVSGAQLSGKTDSGSYAVKELVAFGKFTKARKDRGAWRDFVFEHVDPAEAERLNAEGRRDVEKSASPIAAGIAVRAKDSGRVLLLQRALDESDAAAGKFEFPGGCIEDGESTWDAAVREWQEECGCALPEGEVITAWMSHNGVYKGFVYEVPSEDSVSINMDPDRRSILNPDDPDGDCPEIAAWFDPRVLPGNPMLRSEVLLTPWNYLVATV